MTALAGLAVVIGGFAIAGVEGVLELTRLDGDPDLLRLPASGDGDWAWMSYATKTALACWLFAWAMRLWVRGWADGWDMRIWPVAAAIALALASPGDDETLTLAGAALVVVVARNVALVPRPAPRWRPSRWELAGVTAAIVLLAVVALAYRPLHPLSAAFSDRSSDTGFALGTGENPSRGYAQFGFILENEGLAGVTVRSIHAYDAAPADVDVLARRDVEYARSFAGLWRSLNVEHIGRGDQLHGLLQLSRSSCRGPYGVHTDEVVELVVRYETLGVKGTQRLPIDPPARLRCPARR